MLGIKHIKFDSTLYVVHYKNGKIRRQGRGLSFYYYAPNSSIVAIPSGSDDVQFIFNESTIDYQKVSIQGQLTYKIESAKQLAELLDFTVDSDGNYKKDDKEKLNQRLINEAQTATSTFIKSLDVKQAIVSAKQIEEKISEGLLQSKAVEMLGIKPLSVNVLAVKPEPAMAKALEAKTREALQGEADQAIYDRRNFAVEQERRIKESELNTEIAVEEKKKQIVEKKMQTDILKAENDRQLREMRIEADTAVEKKQQQAEEIRQKHKRKIGEMEIETQTLLEEKRKAFVSLKTENQRKEAQTEAYATEQNLNAYKGMDWRVLMAMHPKASSAAQNIALAFRELAENSQKIENLNITPDLLQNMIQTEQQAQ